MIIAGTNGSYRQLAYHLTERAVIDAPGYDLRKVRVGVPWAIEPVFK